MRPFCPILTIGFAPPEEGKRDLRRCTAECALYDKENDQCCIKSCAEQMNYISGQLDDTLSMMSEGFVPFEEYEDYDYDPNTIGATN